MAIVGRPRKPTSLRILEGAPPCKLPKGEATFADAPLSVPAALAGLPAAAAEWRRLAPLLSARGLLTDGDISALLAYCVVFSQLLDAAADVAENGAVLTSADGKRVTNPAANTLLKSASLLRSFCSEFGLTPASRAKVGAATADNAQDPMEALLTLGGG